MEDYTVDNRGDIGSTIRDQTMIMFVQVTHQIYKQKKDLLTSELILKIVKCLLHQLVEKIDRCRLVAGSSLQEMYNRTLIHYDFPHKHSLAIFETANINALIEEKQKEMDTLYQVPTVQGLIHQVSFDQKVNA
jgi:hypothetical protein